MSTDDPIRNAMGELLRAAFKATRKEDEPEQAFPEGVQRFAHLLGREPDELSDDPEAARDAVSSVLDAAGQLLGDALSQDPERRESAKQAMRDLDGKLKGAGFSAPVAEAEEAATRVREAAEKGRDDLASVLQQLADVVEKDPRIAALRERVAGEADDIDA